jgi:hypothetical protein
MNMKDKNLLQAFALIDEWPNLQRFSGNQTKAAIQKAQDLLDIAFPPSYRAFLERYGAGGFGSLDLYGIVDERLVSEEIPNGIWLTLNERITSKLPSSLLIITKGDDDDTYVCLQCVKDTDVEVPVIAYDPLGMDSLAESYRLAKTFGSFLLRMVQMVIDEES